MPDPVLHIYRQRTGENDGAFEDRVNTGLRAAARPFTVHITDVYSPLCGPQTTVHIIEDSR